MSFVDMLPATIAAGSQIDNRHYLEQVIRLSQSPDIELRRRAVFSMARPQMAERNDHARFCICCS